MECKRQILWHVVVVSLTLLPSSWHAIASVTGRCEGAYRFPGEHSCGAALASYNASIRLLGNVAEVLVNETFANDGPHVIEDGVLTLVIPAGAVLLGFKTHVGNSDELSAGTLHGTVRLRQAGLPLCSRSSQWGSFFDGASPNHPGSLRISIGAIPPGGVVHVQIEYAQEVKAVIKPGKGGAFRLQLQMPTGARRRPTGQNKGNDDASVLAVKLALLDHECRTNACATSPLQIRSPSHSAYLQVAQEKGTTIGSLKASGFQDVVLEVGPTLERHTTNELQASLFIERHSHTGLSAALLSLPTAVAPSSFAAFEVVLILDRSHSMSGARFDRVKHAMQTFLRSLPLDIAFNFMGLESPDSLLFTPASKPLSRESFDEAVSHISAKTADAHTAGTAAPLGAAKALTNAFRLLERRSGTQLRIIFVTDRHVPDADQVIQEVIASCNKINCQLSTIGLGWGASPQFVEGAARAGHGTARFVAERGSVEPLERALVSHLAEALQFQVTDVEVDWSALSSKNAGDFVMLSKLRERSHVGEAEDLDNDVDIERFLAQGGIREVRPVRVDIASVAAGERLLGLAFLGDVSGSEEIINASVRIRANVGGTPFETTTSVVASWNGRALHAICARRFLDDISSAGAGNRDLQFRALGLAYGVSTAQTQWFAIPGRSEDQQSPVGLQGPSDLKGKDASACSPQDGMSGLQGIPASSAGSSRPAFSGDGGWDSDPAKARRLQADSELSVRRPPAVAAAEARKLSIQGLLHVSNKLSTIDFSNLGASLSLKSIPSAHGRGSLDFTSLAAGMSLRNFVGFGFDGAHMGASLSVKHLGKGSLPWWSGGYGDDGEGDFYGGFGDMASARYGYGSGLAMRQFDKMGKKGRGVESGVESSLSLRSLRRCGASFSMFALQRFSSQLSALDFAHIGSSLSLRSVQKPPVPSQHRYDRFGMYPGGSLSTLDHMFLASSLSLSSAGFGRRALSLHGAHRFHALDPLGFGYDGGFDEFGGDRRGLEKGSSLSLRCFSRVGKTLSVVAGTALPDSLAAKLSVADLANIGSSLSLRRPDRGGDRGARRGGFGPFGGVDYGRYGSSMSVNRLARFPGDMGADDLMGFSDTSRLGSSVSTRTMRGFGDFHDFRGSADDVSPWEAFGNDMESRMGARLPDSPKPSIRSAGRLGGIGGALPSEASTRKSGGNEDGRPDAWVGIGVAGGLVVPLLPVHRNGLSCQPSQQTATISWMAISEKATDGKKKKKRRPAAVYAATGPLVKGGTARLTELAPPKATDGGKDKVDLSISVQLSHACMLTARPSQSASSTLFEISLAREDFPANGNPSADALRTALLAHHKALTDDTKGTIADPLRIEVRPTIITDGGKGMQTLIGLQRFDGSFDLSKVVTADMKIIGILPTQLAAFVAVWGSSEVALAVAHTAVSVAVLRTRHIDFEDGWGLLAKKAEAWLAGNTVASAESSPAVVAGCVSAEACIAAAELVVARWVSVL